MPCHHPYGVAGWHGGMAGDGSPTFFRLIADIPVQSLPSGVESRPTNRILLGEPSVAYAMHLLLGAGAFGEPTGVRRGWEVTGVARPLHSSSEAELYTEPASHFRCESVYTMYDGRHADASACVHTGHAPNRG